MISGNTPSIIAGKRIVIIEDEGMSIMAFQRACQRAGLMVVGIACNGREGVDIALQEHPDIVLTDINMPIMDGLEAARLILEKLRVCVVFLTALSDNDMREQIARSGCHGCAIKPMGNEDLIQCLEESYARYSGSEIRQ